MRPKHIEHGRVSYEYGPSGTWWVRRTPGTCMSCHGLVMAHTRAEARALGSVLRRFAARAKA